VWDDKDELMMVDNILEGKSKPKLMSKEERTAKHAFILDNVPH